MYLHIKFKETEVYLNRINLHFVKIQIKILSEVNKISIKCSFKLDFQLFCRKFCKCIDVSHLKCMKAVI